MGLPYEKKAIKYVVLTVTNKLQIPLLKGLLMGSRNGTPLNFERQNKKCRNFTQDEVITIAQKIRLILVIVQGGSKMTMLST